MVFQINQNHNNKLHQESSYKKKKEKNVMKEKKRFERLRI